MLPARILDEAGILPLDEHPAAVYLARLSRRSRQTQLGALETIARILSGGRLGWRALPWHEIRYQHAQALRRQLADRYAVATANRTLAAFRGTMQECWRLGLLDRESYSRTVDLAPLRGEPPPHGRALAPDELRRLLAACSADGTPAGSRDAALLGLLYACGLRRAEAVALDVGDYDAGAGSILVRKGKGGKARLTYPSAGARALLEAWLAAATEDMPENILHGYTIGAGDRDSRSAVSSSANPHLSTPLFVRIRRGGLPTAERLADQSVRLILRLRAAQAGVAACAPHDLRRSHATHLLAEGVDLSTVQRLLGHASPLTTARYDKRGDEAKRLAAARLDATFAGVAGGGKPGN